MAEESAGAIARWRHDHVARLEGSGSRWEYGAADERATANALKTVPAGWTVLHDVRWPGRPFATIDHIAIGPAGVFVIDSKAWSGTVRLADGVLRENGRPRTREVLSAHEAAAALWRRLPHLPRVWVTPVLCIVSADVTGWAGKVAVCHDANIVELLTSQPPVLSPEVVRSVVSDLRLQFPPSLASSPASPPAQSPEPRRPFDRFRSSLAALFS